MSLRDVRKKSGLRQEDVAKKLDVDQSTVSFWESGRFKPSRKYRKKLAKLYGLTVEELFGEV